MAQRPTVPKFGNWDPNDHVPYTAVFNNARAGKGGNIINPNDPSGNQDFFLDDDKRSEQPSLLDNTNRESSNETLPKPRPRHQRRASREDSEFGLGIEDSGQRSQGRHGRRSSRGDGESQQQAEPLSTEVAGRQFPTPKITPGDASRRGASGVGNQENGASERAPGEIPFGNLGPGQSPVHPQAYQGRLGKKLGSASPAWDRKPEVGTTLAPGTPGRTRPDRGAAPLPKFGDWDVNNPASGDGFTVIFNKARDEKKTGGAVRIPVMQADSPLRPEADPHKTQAAAQESSCSSWLCCCFQSSAAK